MSALGALASAESFRLVFDKRGRADAYVDGQLIGRVTFDADDGQAVIRWLTLIPGLKRGVGHGRTFVRRLVAHLRARGIRELRLLNPTSQAVVRAFVAAAGEPTYVEDGAGDLSYEAAMELLEPTTPSWIEPMVHGGAASVEFPDDFPLLVMDFDLTRGEP